MSKRMQDSPKQKPPKNDRQWPSFSEFFQRSALPMKTLDQEGRVLQVNSAFSELLGLPKARLETSSEREFIHPADLLELRRSFRSLAAYDVAFSEAKARYKHREGHWISTLINHLWLSSPSSSDPKILALVIDISCQETLRWQERKQHFDQLARELSHELNNLLTVIVMKLVLLEQSAEDVGAVRRAVEELQLVVERIKLLSQRLARAGQNTD